VFRLRGDLDACALTRSMNSFPGDGRLAAAALERRADAPTAYVLKHPSRPAWLGSDPEGLFGSAW